MTRGKHDKYYAQLLGKLAKEDPRWFFFTGRCIVAGIKAGFTNDQIMEYVFETVHGQSMPDEVPLEEKQIREDMELYFA